MSWYLYSSMGARQLAPQAMSPLMPPLGDFAGLKAKEGSEDPDVALGGPFNESWKLQ